MHLTVIARTLGLLLMILSLSLLPPMGIYLWYQQGSLYPFLISFIATLLVGALLWLPTRKTRQELKTRDGFLIVTLAWVVACVVSAMPFYLYFYPHLSFTDALFESVSGLSTSGATTFSHLDTMPHSILYYRQQLTLLGGVGVVVIALSILPVLGIGGMQLYMAETGGPIKTSRLRPRLRQTTKALWLIYLGLVIVCAFAYWLAGMSLFDAVCESFSSVATAGFSTHDANFAYYHSHLIEVITTIFMILGATNFGLHYQCFKQKRLSVYWRDPEFKMYLAILVTLLLISVITLTAYNIYHHLGKTVADSLFTVTTALTTTGYELVNLDEWPTFLPYLVMLSCFIGGCAGSTSGGIKVLRFLLLKNQSKRELKRLIHPHGIFSLYLGEEVLSEEVVQGIWGFVAIFLIFLVAIFLGLLATGLDLRTAFGSALGALTNTGLGLGQTAITFESINNPSKWIITFAMFAGRLEILTILILFTPTYWKKG
jgi:trk/ktr system potassium uptake protein